MNKQMEGCVVKTDEWDTLKGIVENSGYLVFFGGAGVSTESNIPDFRSAGGLYSEKTKYNYPPERILSRSFFYSHPDIFYEFYRSKMIYRDARPNDAHISLAKLEKRGILKCIITQNIDGLHQMAGSVNVIELHGSVFRNNCTRCGRFFSLDYIINSEETVPKCDKCGGIIKPDVVLYEEPLNENDLIKSVEAISKADTLIVGGTSLAVYPAAGLINYFRGKNLVLINKSPTPYDRYADLVINDSIGKVLKSVVQ